jgi:hypothetical protein
MKLLKYALLIALIVTGIQVMLYGLTGAYNGLFVRLGWVAPGPVVTLRDRVTRSMDRARSDIQSESDQVDQVSHTQADRVRRKLEEDRQQGTDRLNHAGGDQ